MLLSSFGDLVRKIFLAGKIAAVMLSVCACETTAVPPSADDLTARGGFILPYTVGPQGHYLVDIEINNEGPFQFLIDTGATTSPIYQSLMDILELKEISGETILVHGLISSSPRPVARLSSVRVGKFVYEDIRVPVLERQDDALQHHGVLGMNILKQHVLVFDADERTVTLLPQSAFEADAYNSWDTIRLISDPYDIVRSDLLFFRIRSNNVSMIALLDLGASFSALNWDGANFPELVVARRLLGRQQEISGAIDDFKPSLEARFGRLSAGEYSWVSQKLLIMDIATEEMLGVAEAGMLIAGVDMFAGRSFVLSPRDKLLIIRPNAEDTKRNAREQTSTQPN